ncbi:MAG: twin-arginine translocase subunit TatC [Bacteroidaceae bacterium]|nr:twin-arginine translocase subunit TatC [Bacteroidaceae bacterium]
MERTTRKRTTSKSFIHVSSQPSFWDHLDQLRSDVIKMLLAVVVCAIVAFCFKEALFGVILAPQSDSFVTYRLLQACSEYFAPTASSFMAPVDVVLINTGLAEQFVLHVKTSLWVGFLVASPYIIYLLFHFVTPALYANERKYAARLVLSGFIMFALGVVLTYFLFFPLIFRFLGAYQVSEAVANTVTLTSYLETLMLLCLSMGVVFEIPVLCWFLGKMGLIHARMMSRYRRHAVVALLVLAAIITPTSDVFTLLLVFAPMWLLYEFSILIVRRA